MKRESRTWLFAAIIGATMLAAAQAHATNYPTPQQPIGVGLALSGSLSGAAAEGGDAAAKSKATAGVGDITVTPGSTKEGDTYVFPPPSTTLVPQAMGECTKTDSEAASFFWSLFNGSHSKQSAEIFCAGMRLAERYEAACQYLSADMIRNRLAALLFPGSGDLPAQPALANLTTEQCRRTAR